jgi:hypothetical protein
MTRKREDVTKIIEEQENIANVVVQKKDKFCVNNMCKFLIVLLFGVCITLFLLDTFEVVDVVFEINSINDSKDNCDYDCECNNEQVETGDDERPFYYQNTTEKEKKRYFKNLCKIELDYDEVYYNGKKYNEDEIDEDDFIGNGDLLPGEFCVDGACVLIDNSEKIHTYDCETGEYISSTYDGIQSDIVLNTACASVDNNGDFYNPDYEEFYCEDFICKITLNGKKYSKDCRGE